MGQKRQLLLRFLADHPLCCFCAGKENAATKDHLPPRSVFVEKKCPEGYIFPACASCNQGSSRDDMLVGFLSRWNAGREPTATEQREWKTLLLAFNEHYPGQANLMLPTARERRNWMEKHSLSKPEGTAYGELPIIKIPPLIHGAIDRFNAKLTKALHYKHSGRIIPPGAWIRIQWWTNAHFIANEFPKELTEVITGRTQLKRGTVTLDDQYSYNYAVSDDGAHGMYLSYFREVFCLLGMVVFDGKQMKDLEQNVRSS